VLAAVSRSPENAVIHDIPEPGPPLAGRTDVRLEAAGIRGSDLHHYSGHTAHCRVPRDYCPRIPDHEFSAVSTEAGLREYLGIGPERGVRHLRSWRRMHRVRASLCRSRSPRRAPGSGGGAGHTIGETAGGPKRDENVF
jgi:threonine dehydrogenase-like Zn-dependent dehydrogenase